MGWRLSLRILRRPLRSSSQELQGQSIPNLVCSICGVRRQEIVNCHDPLPQGEIILGEKVKN